MMVEPESFCWLVGRLTPKRDGATWLAELQRWSRLEYLVSDAGTGLCRGVKMLQRQRRTMRQKKLLHSLDVFHVLREGGRAVRREYTPVRRSCAPPSANRNAWSVGHGMASRTEGGARPGDVGGVRRNSWIKRRLAKTLGKKSGPPWNCSRPTVA